MVQMTSKVSLYAFCYSTLQQLQSITAIDSLSMGDSELLTSDHKQAQKCLFVLVNMYVCKLAAEFKP